MAITVEQRNDLIQAPLIGTLRAPYELLPRATIVVASYNVYNLFDEKSDKPKPEEQMTALGDMLRSINADVISFAEVKDERTIRALFRDFVNPGLPKDDKYDGFVCLPANDPRGINVALVTRLSIRGAMTFHDREFGSADRTPVKFSRDLLGVEIQMTPDEEHTYIHFATHLKSKIGGPPADAKRELEASEVAAILTGRTFGCKLITNDLLLAGDFNEEPEQPVAARLAGATLVDLFDGADEPNFTYPTYVNARTLKRTGALRRKYPPARLDYIYASPSMAGRVTNRTVHYDEAADLASDHYPISLTLNVG